MQWAAANERALRLFREAAAVPHLGLSLCATSDEAIARHLNLKPRQGIGVDGPWPEQNPPLLAASVSAEFVGLRRGAELLEIDARRAALEGDGVRVSADLEAITRMAEHAYEHPTLVGHLTGISFVGRAARLIGTLLHERPELFNDAALARLSHRLGGLRGGGRLTVDFSGERAVFEDLLQRLYTDDGKGGGHPVPKFLDLYRATHLLGVRFTTNTTN
jgi:hypothetical protein